MVSESLKKYLSKIKEKYLLNVGKLKNLTPLEKILGLSPGREVGISVIIFLALFILVKISSY